MSDIGIEHGAGSRGFGTFPRKWGVPPFEPAERAGWIAGNLSADRIAAGRGAEVRALMPHLEPRARSDGRRVPPAILNRLRALELLARRLGP